MPPGRIRVLRELLLHPERELYLRELAARARVSLSSAQSELRRLTSAGLLHRTRRGRQTFYRANTRAPLFPELRSILLKTVGLAGVLRDALSRLDIELAFVYGSLAAGEERETSDVDLLVVGSARPRQVSDLLGPCETQVGRQINPVVLTTREFRRRLKAKDPFLSDLIGGPKLFVIADEDELARLAR